MAGRGDARIRRGSTGAVSGRRRSALEARIVPAFDSRSTAEGSSHRRPGPPFEIPHGEFWVFGYGSLMWDPGFPYLAWAPALVYGYHRALCIASNRWRGTPEQPGLVLGLDHGGACRGIAFRLARADIDPALAMLWAREMRRHVYRPRLVRARLPDRDVRALAFIADRRHSAYVGGLSVRATARRIARCCGQRGANLEYVARTVEHLRELGVRDHYLQRVLVAARRLARKAGDAP